MINNQDIEDELQKIEEIAPQYATAKALSFQAQEWKKTQRSILYSQAVGKTVADKEHWVAVQSAVAVANEGIAAAISNEEKLRWDLKQAELKIEIWRTQQASARLERMV
jgi:hypothetical protein